MKIRTYIFIINHDSLKQVFALFLLSKIVKVYLVGEKHGVEDRC